MSNLPQNPPRKANTVASGIIGAIAMFIVVYAIVTMLMGGSGDTSSPAAPSATPTPKDAEDAFFMSQQFLENRLVSPGSAKYPSFDDSMVTVNGDGSFTVKSYVDSQNRMGGLMRSDYTERLHPTGGDNWKLDSIQINQRD